LPIERRQHGEIVGETARLAMPILVRARAMKTQQVNKRHPNDARGIAQMMRAGLYKAVHVRTLASQSGCC
jgi:transposase